MRQHRPLPVQFRSEAAPAVRITPVALVPPSAPTAGTVADGAPGSERRCPGNVAKNLAPERTALPPKAVQATDVHKPVVAI